MPCTTILAVAALLAPPTPAPPPLASPPLGLPAATTSPAVAPSPAATPGPCAGPEYRALDFWVGEWDVIGAAAPPGTPPARSRIERVDGGCVVQETYTTARGYSGRSLNIYDRETRRWQQFWVDSTGGLHHYRGEARDGKVHFEAENVRLGPPGTPLARVRMTFENRGPAEVRQLMEQSTDGGRTWTTAFDGTYRRRAGP